jgi:hypothetical protein
MWIPETAVDVETLEILAHAGIKFTILSQRQAKRVRDESGNWHDVRGEMIDPSMVYLYTLPSGKTINLFFYHGPISHEVSFGGLLQNGEAFAKKLNSAFDDGRRDPQMVHIATDGETFGHHHRFGDMALSYCLHYIESNNLAKITNYGEFLEKNPPARMVEISENSSWSCIHGVERWRDNCGCNSGIHPGWSQNWRKSFRNAMDWLREVLITLFESESSKYLKKPWDVRDDYIDVVLDRSRKNVEKFLSRHAVKKLSSAEKVIVLKLLEMQKNALLMYTSCGWFFDDISGIEAVQIMQYASEAMQIAEELNGENLEARYVRILEGTPSNVLENAAEAYNMFVRPSKSDLLRVGAHYCISSIFEEYFKDIKICCYSERTEIYDRIDAGKLRLVVGKARIASDITWEDKTVSFVVLHLGDHNLNAGVKEFAGDGDFSTMHTEIKEAFEKGDVPEVIRLMAKHFGEHIYSLWHLFKDEQRKVLDQVLHLTYEGIDASYRQIYESNIAIMNFFHSLHLKPPNTLSLSAEYIINSDLKKIFGEDDVDVEKLKKLIEEAKQWSVKIDTKTIGFVVSAWIRIFMEKVRHEPEDLQLLKQIDSILETLKPLSLPLDIWEAQNIYFSTGRSVLETMQERAARKDPEATQWLDKFHKLGSHLHVKF